MKPAALRVGLFTVLGLAALVLAAALAGGRFWVPTDRALMRFDSSVYGLQTGAPVVYRGVKLGQVQRIGLGSPGGGAQALPAVPVEVEFERERLLELLQAVAGPVAGAAAADAQADAVNALVARGLVARLAMQSLLTGQLYIDLDLAPATAATQALRPTTGRPADAGLPLVPTAPTRLQTLQAQLENLDLAQLGQDLAAVARAARQLLDSPEPARALARAADAAQALERVAASLQRDLPKLTRGAETTLAEGQRSLQQLGQAAQQVAAAASQVQALAGGGAPALAEVQRSAAELTRAARALREAADADSSLRVNAERALQDVSRAAQSLGELGETLERSPDVLWRGRAGQGGSSGANRRALPSQSRSLQATSRSTP